MRLHLDDERACRFCGKAESDALAHYVVCARFLFEVEMALAIGLVGHPLRCLAWDTQPLPRPVEPWLVPAVLCQTYHTLTVVDYLKCATSPKPCAGNFGLMPHAACAAQ